jgi:hypothetical protein
MDRGRKFLLPLMLLFIVCVLFLVSAGTLFTKWNIDRNVLLVANSLFFIMSMLAFFVQRKAMQNSNPNVFVRSILSGMMIKMVVCVLAVLAYTFLSGDSFNKAAVFISLLLYLIYLAIEVTVLMKLNKQRNA